jgi:hypothetical protein
MSDVLGACVTWDEDYPIVHLAAVSPTRDQELTAIPADLAAEYAQAHAAWYGVQRKLKRYLREVNERPTPELAPASA